MHTHEYQAKQLLEKYGIPIPPFGVAATLGEAEHIIERLGLNRAIVKIQVHAGGRGKAGGVKYAKSRDEILEVCKKLIGMTMVNNQTGPRGMSAHQVLITEPVDIAREYYLGVVIDRERGLPLLIASPKGGIAIEEESSENILQLPIEISGTIRPYQLTRLSNFMGWKGREGGKIAQAMARAFVKIDADLLEINPLVKTPDGKIWALDAKLSIDDNALFRQEQMASLFDPTQMSKSEVAAKQSDLAYVSLEGDIGCMVNGAGLAMATMDIIHHYGGKPANFLDVGGGASTEKVATGCKIILSDPEVQAILVNIFGGIMNCATIAKGIVSAAHELEIRVPLIVRLEGTNMQQGRQILDRSHLKMIIATGMADAAKKAVASIKSG